MNEQVQRFELLVRLSEDEAEALAQLVKRLIWSDIRPAAVDDDEAYMMFCAIRGIERSLRNIGFSPR